MQLVASSHFMKSLQFRKFSPHRLSPILFPPNFPPCTILYSYTSYSNFFVMVTLSCLQTIQFIIRANTRINKNIFFSRKSNSFSSSNQDIYSNFIANKGCLTLFSLKIVVSFEGQMKWLMVSKTVTLVVLYLIFELVTFLCRLMELAKVEKRKNDCSKADY